MIDIFWAAISAFHSRFFLKNASARNPQLIFQKKSSVQVGLQKDSTFQIKLKI